MAPPRNHRAEASPCPAPSGRQPDRRRPGHRAPAPASNWPGWPVGEQTPRQSRQSPGHSRPAARQEDPPDRGAPAHANEPGAGGWQRRSSRQAAIDKRRIVRQCAQALGMCRAPCTWRARPQPTTRTRVIRRLARRRAGPRHWRSRSARRQWSCSGVGWRGWAWQQHSDTKTMPQR